MLEEKSKTFKEIRNYVFYLLRYRDLSKKEIKEKLCKKGYPLSVIEEVVTYLEEKKFIDDEGFAERFSLSRIKRGFGQNKIKSLLKLRGIPESIIDKVLREIFCKVGEEEIARRLLFKKRYLPIKKTVKREENFKRISRIYRFLSHRGFSYSVIEKIIREETSLDFYE